MLSRAKGPVIQSVAIQLAASGGTHQQEAGIRGGTACTQAPPYEMEASQLVSKLLYPFALWAFHKHQREQGAVTSEKNKSHLIIAIFCPPSIFRDIPCLSRAEPRPRKESKGLAAQLELEMAEFNCTGTQLLCSYKDPALAQYPISSLCTLLQQVWAMPGPQMSVDA